MFGLFDKKEKMIAISTGEIIEMSQVSDDVFAQKMLGDGFAINPAVGEIYAPCDGKIINVFLTKHALTMETENGLELLIHIGIDTVGLNGECFDVLVEDGQKVKAGQKLMNVDLEFIKNKGLDTVTPVVITNMEKVKSINFKMGNVTMGEEIGEVKIN